MATIELKKGEKRNIHELSSQINAYLDFSLTIIEIKGSLSINETDMGVKTIGQPLEEKEYKLKGFELSIVANSDSEMTYSISQFGKIIV